MKDGIEEGVWIGMIGAAVVMCIIWLATSAFLEDKKVANGYLTNKGKIYSVEYVADKKDMKDYIEQFKESK